jgi:Domain of unknown function (DUF1707)
MNTNDRMRISDSDRDRVAAQLRDYYAEGRLSSEELDERVTAALNAKTAGDLRRLMSDLPSPSPAQPGTPNTPPFAAPPWGGYRRRGPRLMPVLLLILLAALLLPGGWIFFTLLKLFLLFWLVVALMGLVGAAVFRHRVRGVVRDRMGSWQGPGWPGAGWRGPGRDGPGRRGPNWRGW